MSDFQGFRRHPPAVRQVAGSDRQWELVEEGFSYTPWKVRNVTNIEIPKGFVTDFASIPRFFWRFLHPTGRYGSAAIVHDYLCVMAQRSNNYIAPTHKVAAQIFRDAMQELGVGGFKIRVMYRAVLWGGPKWSAKK